MLTDSIFEIAIDPLLASPVGQKLKLAMDTISSVQRNFLALRDSEDSASLNLLKIGTVFQVFLIDTLASGKKPGELAPDDWKSIAEKVSKYAILQDGQSYSVFVFTLYADYIDLSVRCLSERIPKSSRDAMKSSLASIQDLANNMRHNAVDLSEETITEVTYIENCLWLSLEAMIKLLSASLAEVIGPEFTQLAQAVSQLAFEYGRYVLYAKEQAILESYILNQKVLDEQLQHEYEEFLAELQETANRFQTLLDAAFTPALHESLLQSVALARAAGVREEELLSSVEQIDSFFMD